MAEITYRTPGQYIQALLDEREWTQLTLAIVLGVDKTVVSKLIAGKKALDAPMALVLGELFNVEPEVFLGLQKEYDLAQARIVSIPDPGRATRAQLFGGLPIAEMVKRGWLPGVADAKNVSKVEAALVKFFKANSPSEIVALPHAAKKSNVTDDATPVQLAWLYRVKEIAGDMLVAKYSEQAVTQCIKKLEPLRQSPEEIRNVPRLLAECGIRFLIVETLPSAKIDGVCFWMNDNSPVVALTTRFDRIDNFWFVLRHELEHVLRRDGLEKPVMDVELEGEKAGEGQNIPEQERAANAAGSSFCVPPDMMQKFFSSKAPFFAERDVIAFAKMVKVHPGLVAGQLRHKTGRHNLFTNLLVKVRNIITPTSIVDGWGQIAPVGE